MTEETIFQEALARSAADRARFLDQACSGQPQLRAAVEALLAAHQKPDNLLDNPPGNLAATFDSQPAGVDSAATGEHTPHAFGSQDAEVPRTLTTDYRRDGVAGVVIGGRYTLQEKIGEGGMGEVWVAKQTEPVKRKVALKLIKAGMDSRAVLQRFEQERQALALMDHPHIARVLDGGMTPTGQPFFVMELVNGLPLNKFCDELKLTPKARLELFVPICQAVQHAHQKGIVHRDLKPANILVTMIDGKPVPKVIDFGVAKATSGKLTEETMSTGFGTVVGTLEYMSPEQAGFSGEDIDTRADIYSLGVILYELLTGLRPIDATRLRKAALTEMIRMIQEEEPSKPSTRLSTDALLPSLAAVRQTEPKKLMTMLRGELDWVVMKCLEKQRDRRYETANALARDVQRYLNDEVVEARPPSAGYRFKKFVRRHKGPVVAAMLILFALLTGIAGTTFGLIRANRSAEAERLAKLDAEDQKEKAQQRSRQIEKSNEILAWIFDDLDIRKVKEGNEPLEAVLAGRLVKAATQLEGEAVGHPLVVADLQHRLGRSLQGLGYAREAIPLFSKAAETSATKRGPNHPDTLKFLNSLAMAYRAAGMLDQTVKLSEDIRERAIALLGADHRDALIAAQNLALVYKSAGRTDLALPLLEETLQRSKEKLEPNDVLTIACMSNLAQAYMEDRKLDLALPLLQDALKLAETGLGAEHPDTLQVLNSLGGCYRVLEKPELALPIAERILKLRQAQLGPNHPDTLESMNNLAAIYDVLGKANLALPLMEEVVKLERVKLGDDHPSTITSMSNLAEIYRRVGRLDLAVPLFEESLKSAKAKFDPEHPSVIKCTHGLAAAYWATQQFDKSVPMFEYLVSYHEARLGRRHPETLSFVANLGANYKDAGRLADSLPLLEEVYRASPEYPALRKFGHALLEVYLKANNRDEATMLLRELLPDMRKMLPKDSPELAGVLAQLSMGLLAQKQWVEAEPLIRESLAIREREQPDAWTTFNTQSMLGATLLGQKNYADAEPLLLQGYEGMKAREKSIPPQANTRIPEAIERLIELHTATNKPDEVTKWQAERAKYPPASASATENK